MKPNRKQEPDFTDAELYGMFREFCDSDEECRNTIRDSKKAFMLINKDKVYRSYDDRKESL